MNGRIDNIGNESSIGHSFPGAKVSGIESSRERKFQGAKRPGSESSRERKGLGAKVPGSELAREQKGQVPELLPHDVPNSLGLKLYPIYLLHISYIILKRV